MFDAAATQYQLADKDFNSFKGTAGLSFSDQQAFDHVNGDAQLKTLTSPKFKTFNDDGSEKVAGNTFNYTVKSADSGHFGTPVNVYYTYPT